MREPHGPREFVTTHWSLVAAAGADEASRTQVRKALEELCRSYWYPLYAFVRARGYSPADAQDLTQSFFARIIETGGLASAERGRGRFRSYLLGALKHFLANEWHRARTRKRGGGAVFVELDALDPEERYAVAACRPEDTDAGFDREWARETVGRATEALRGEYESAGRGAVFEALKGSLTGADLSRDEAAARLGMTVGAVKVAVHRLRSRYRAILRAGIAETVADPGDVDDEMRYLLTALRGESSVNL